jgi:hypothetical protein
MWCRWPRPNTHTQPNLNPTATNLNPQCLYADTFMTREEFKQMFNHELYDKMREKVRCGVRVCACGVFLANLIQEINPPS